ncbi:MAG: hypothetical protein ABR986_01055 [Methanomassiliicoccales archaeon]|jgi:hypothetical protein
MTKGEPIKNPCSFDVTKMGGQEDLMRQAMFHEADHQGDMNLNHEQERMTSPNVILTWSRSDLSMLPINDFPEDGRLSS